MSEFNSMILTEKGQVLYAKGQAGATINFTKMAVGIGDIGSTDPTTLTDLVNRKFDIEIQSKTVNTLQKVALISGTLTNENITEAVYICEIGLFAEDPDEGEILYSYASAGEKGDYTSPASNGPYSWNYQVYAAIGNAPNITITLSNLQYDTSVINSNTNLVIIKGGNQKAINQSIDNKLKIYSTTNSENTYTITSADITTLTDGYPILARFNANSTGEISLIINGSSAHDVVDYFGNKIKNVRNGLIAKLIWDESNSNFQLQGKGGGGDATEDQVLSGKKVTVDSGPIVGTLDLTNLVTGNIKSGITINGIAGKSTVVDTSDALATATQLLSGSSMYVGGIKIAGGMANNGAVNITPSTVNQSISQGYHNGSGVVYGDPDLIASNILSTANIFGIQGSVTLQSMGGHLVTDGIIPEASGSNSPTTIYLGYRPTKVIISVVGNLYYNGVGYSSWNSSSGSGYAVASDTNFAITDTGFIATQWTLSAANFTAIS